LPDAELAPFEGRLRTERRHGAADLELLTGSLGEVLPGHCLRRPSLRPLQGSRPSVSSTPTSRARGRAWFAT